MKYVPRAVAIQRRLRENRVTLLQMRRVGRQFKSRLEALWVYVGWHRARRRIAKRLILQRRFAATVTERYIRTQRLAKVYERRRVQLRPPARLHWVIPGVTNAYRYDGVLPLTRPPNMKASQRLRQRLGVASIRKAEGAFHDNAN